MAAMSNRSMAETPMDVLADDVAIMNTPLVRGFFLVAYLLVFCSCIGGNFLILLVICTQRSMRTATNFYLANLAVADLLVGFFCVFPNAAHFVLFEHYGTWPFGKLACHAYVFFLQAVPNASAGILVLLSIERFVAVLRPMLVHHLLTKSVLLCSAVMVWGFSLIMNLPYLFAVQFIEMNRKTGGTYGICTRRFLIMADINVLQAVTITNLIAWYAIPLVILLVIYISIACVLMRTTDVAAVARSSQNNRGSRSNSELKATRRLPKLEAVDSRKRVIRLVVVIVLCFAVLSLPRYLYLTWSVFRTKNAPRCLNCLSALVQPGSFLLLFANSGINPYLYSFLSQRFRAAIADTFACGTNKHKASSMKKHQPMTRLQQKLHRLVAARPSASPPDYPKGRLSNPTIPEEVPLRNMGRRPVGSVEATTTTSSHG